jgi:phage tail sheath protein FI
MPQYFSPGVYTEEIPSALKPIIGVSTSTACFIGLVPDVINIPFENPNYDPTDTSATAAPAYLTRPFPFRALPADGSSEGKAFQGFQDATKALPGLAADPKRPVSPADPGDKAKVATFLQTRNVITSFKATYPELSDSGAALSDFQKNSDTLKTLVDPANPNHPSEDTKKDATKLAQYQDLKKKVAKFKAVYPDIAEAGVPVLCTTFGDFQRSFGDFSTDGLHVPPGGDLPTDGTGMQNQLAHAVFGFFNNGGTRCYVVRAKDIVGLRDPRTLTPLEAIDEISLIAAPGIVDAIVQDNLVVHCEKMEDRFAILDAPVLDDETEPTKEEILTVGNSDYAALYFPWIWVFDPVTQMDPEGSGEVLTAPSGHVAGIYARSDNERGVFKAPANEVVRGALDLDHQVSKNVQDGLNPYGINCIRNINNNITVWGARTIGGNANADLMYINVRRTLMFLRKSIDHSTQWIVFEPNDPTLWGKITRDVSLFLKSQWRAGMLFGTTQDQAFYVKCDEETNPPEDRDIGKVTTQIGVAIVRPAEFVIFQIEQWAGPQAE